jgi:hypothetical protein
VRFDPAASRGTTSASLEDQSVEWRSGMLEMGERFDDAGVAAIVFVHGTFTGSDPLSAYRFVERLLPSSVGAHVVRALKKKTRAYVERVLGDLGNFSGPYVRLFEEALRPPGARIPCTEFVWSSENHHVGRLEAALGLVRVLAAHAELDGRPSRRILVVGHSHAGQVFALTTQLLARSIATEAILDVARARGLDIGALEVDLATLAGQHQPLWRSAGVKLDFVTLGAPNRYAWASLPNVRALHVIAVPPDGSSEDGDWIRRLGVEGSDFPPLRGEERRINAVLGDLLGDGGFAPARVASALKTGSSLPTHGDVAFVEYGGPLSSGPLSRGPLSRGLSHGLDTRLDAMLFHARLVADRFYPRDVVRENKGFPLLLGRGSSDRSWR